MNAALRLRYTLPQSIGRIMTYEEYPFSLVHSEIAPMPHKTSGSGAESPGEGFARNITLFCGHPDKVPMPHNIQHLLSRPMHMWTVVHPDARSSLNPQRCCSSQWPVRTVIAHRITSEHGIKYIRDSCRCRIRRRGFHTAAGIFQTRSPMIISTGSLRDSSPPSLYLPARSHL